MQKTTILTEMLGFIRGSKLTALGDKQPILQIPLTELFKTREAKAVTQKVTTEISKQFCFPSTRSIWAFFGSDSDEKKIASNLPSKQHFFCTIPKCEDKAFLSSLKVPKPCWKPRYSVIVATEDEKTYSELKKLSIPAVLIISERDVESLSDYELVQVLNCESFGLALEQLPQGVALKNMSEAYPERHLIQLSGWQENINILLAHEKELQSAGEIYHELKKELDLLVPLIGLIEEGKTKKEISEEDITSAADDINSAINERLKAMTLSGDKLISIISGKTLPDEIQRIIKEEIAKHDLPSELFEHRLPVAIDRQALESYVFRQKSDRYTSFAEKVKRRATELSEIPASLERLDSLLLAYDFISGVSMQINTAEKKASPTISDRLILQDSINILLEKPQPISFKLDSTHMCSILTGANSGGKTTLIEHIIQLIYVGYLGLPLVGKSELPIFASVYYFAKNKGSAGKGAFENLLTQMSQIKTMKSGKEVSKTLILADEIEAVTEPGAAGKIICATASYFIEKGCFLVVATHLGQEIKDSLPMGCRIDGIEATGLDEDFELIVNHNPIMGKLARSTPELIISRLAKAKKGEYFIYLDKWANNPKHD